MRWSSIKVIQLGFLTGCSAVHQPGDGYLVSAKEFNQIASSVSSVMIVDTRKPNEYAEGHIAGAINISRPDIRSKSYPFGGMMATRDSIALMLGSKGVSGEHLLLLYDGRGGVEATRLWWVLRRYGHRNVKILDGGLLEWKDAGYLLSKSIPKMRVTEFSFTENRSEQLCANLDTLIKAMNDTNYVIIDTRTKEEFTGEKQKTGAFKAGRIPNSVWIDWSQNIDYYGTQKFKNEQKMRELYEWFGVTKDKRIVTYCHSGTRSSHTAFTLSHLLGYPNVHNYDGSWIEWSYHEELPMDSGHTKETAI